MAGPIGQRRLVLRRDTVRLLAVASVLGAIYVGYLAYQNNRAKAYYTALRQENPEQYLDDLRRAEGFESYLAKYRMLEGYYLPKTEAPRFLVGRWTLKAAPERVAPGTVMSDCPAPILFETGLIELDNGDGRRKFRVTYQLSGSDAYITGAEIGELRVRIVAYGASIDHLELVPPGASDRAYAYLCGN